MKAFESPASNNQSASERQAFTRSVIFADRTAWLDERRTYLGGTDIAAIVGKNKYRTPLDVYLEKTGNPVATEPSRFADLGLVMEHLIDQWVTEEFGYKPVAADMMRHPEYPFIACNIDRVIQERGDGSIEIIGEYKTYGSSTANDWGPSPDGPIPDPYYIQAQMQLAITGADQCIVFAVDRDRLDIKPYQVFPHHELHEVLVAQGVKFWREHVETGIQPELSLKDAGKIIHLFPEAGGEIVTSTETDEFIKNLIERNKELKVLEKAVKSMKDQLIVDHPGASVLKSIYGPVKLERRKRETLDAKRICIMAGVSPEIVADNLKTTEYMQVTLPKEKN